MKSQTSSAHPLLYQINTRVWLTELSRAWIASDAGRHPRCRTRSLGQAGLRLDLVLERLADGSPPGKQISRANPEWRREFQETLPDLREDDIAGSGFAITGYTVHPRTGRRCGVGPASRTTQKTRPEADARLRSQSHGAGSSLGRGTPRVLHLPAPSSTWPGRRRTTPGSSAKPATCCWRTAAIPISPAGPTRCSSTTAIPPRKRR